MTKSQHQTQSLDNKQFISGGGNLEDSHSKGIEETKPLFPKFLSKEQQKELDLECRCEYSLMPLCSSIRDLVADYRQYSWNRLESCLRMVQNPLEFILGKPNDESKIGNPPYYRSFHQRRLPNASVRLVYDALLKNYSDLSISEDFAVLHKKISDLISPIEAVPECGQRGLQFGDLCCYDLALRIVYYEVTWKGGSLKLLPDSVYLHSGVIKGIKALWSYKKLDEGKLKRNKDRKAIKSKISLTELRKVNNIPKELFELAPKEVDEDEKISKLPMHLENFLCLYHYQLKSLAGTLNEKEKLKFNEHIEKFNKRKNKCLNKN